MAAHDNMKIGGQAIDFGDHPRRCQCFIKRKGRQCGRWALVNSNYCQFHGGRRSAKRDVKVGHLPRFYSKVLSKTLASFIDDSLGSAPSEQMAVFEELALMRHAANQSVTLYDAVIAKLEDPATPQVQREKLTQSLGLVTGGMREDLKEVVKVAESAARIDALAKDKVSASSLGHIVNQLIRLLYDVCGDEHLTIAQQFEERAKDEVRLPGNNPNGTYLTPDMVDEDVLNMDDTIPNE